MDNKAQAPRGINHLVLNVRNMEVSHKFWTVPEGKPVRTRALDLDAELARRGLTQS